MVQEAYSRAFTLFAALFSFPVPDWAMAAARDVEVLSDVLPDADVLDDWGSRHYELFGMGVFPHAGVYLSLDGLMGGSAARELNAIFLEVGYSPPRAGEETDSISTHLDFLAFLTAAKSGQPGVEKALQFVDQHLLSWLPPYIVATKLEADPFYSRLAGLTWEIVASFVSETGRLIHSNELSEDKREMPSSIKDWSFTLTNSARSGWFVSRSAIAAWGRKMKAPRGFGNRQQMVQTLLESSDRYDTSGPDDHAIQESLTTWLARYQALANENDGALAIAVNPWLQKLRSTEKAFLNWNATRGDVPDHLDEEGKVSSIPDSIVLSSSVASGNESR